MNHTLIRPLVLAVLLLGAGACKQDFLVETDPNAIAAADFYMTENDVRLGLNGAYQSLRNNNGIAEGSGLFSEERSDNTGRNDNQSNAGEPFQFNDFSLLPSNTFLKTHWLALYQIVARANQVLDGSEKVTYAQAATKTNYQA
ncbi:MAG: RagB/SusD family nutrient uptake outer membrane protein, partial [Oxalobacteraceae bacterium]